MIFRAYAALLSYPSHELLAAIDEINEVIQTAPDAQQTVVPLLEQLRKDTLLDAQERYVSTFDRNPSHSLHLFEHIHGESRDRGQAMVNLMQEYTNNDCYITQAELPDYLPLFLEFLSVLSPEEATEMLNGAVDVIAEIEKRLTSNNSLYAGVLTQLISFATVEPKDFTFAPIRDMDEAMETFGPNPEGLEPLLKPEQKIMFHARKSAASTSNRRLG